MRQEKLIAPPDFLTAARIPLAAAFVLFDGLGPRLLILAATGISDVVDGMWARRVGGSRVGAVLDPVCDKLFMAAAFWVVWRSAALGVFEILAALLRDIVAFLSLITVSIRGRPTALPARAGGKAVSIAQVLVLVAFVADSDLIRPLAWAAGAISLYAIADYSRVALTSSHRESADR